MSLYLKKKKNIHSHMYFCYNIIFFLYICVFWICHSYIVKFSCKYNQLSYICHLYYFVPLKQEIGKIKFPFLVTIWILHNFLKLLSDYFKKTKAAFWLFLFFYCIYSWIKVIHPKKNRKHKNKNQTQTFVHVKTGRQ